MTSAAIYLHTYHHLPHEFVARFGEPKAVPLDVQERACRTYCERMGYAVFGVYRATTPPPHNAKRSLRFRIFLEPIEAFYEYESRHPYHFVRNLLERGDVGVIVQFKETGPSGDAWDGVPAEVASALTRIEYASLWEIEPPTERQRRMQELARHVGEAETEEEGADLIAQLSALAAEEESEKASGANAAHPHGTAMPFEETSGAHVHGRMEIVAYRPRAGHEAELLVLVRGHVPLLRGEGLVTNRQPVVMRAADATVVEVFEWASAQARAQAHTWPAVQAMLARFAEACDCVTLASLAECQRRLATFEPIDL